MITGAVDSTPTQLRARLLHDGYAFIHGVTTAALLAPFGARSDWATFVDSWNALDLDTHMADGGQYRRRRHAVFSAPRGGAIYREPHQAHFQMLDYNPVNGGCARWFEPIASDVGDGETLSTVLAFCRNVFGALAPEVANWHIEVHQFRIEARPGERGHPTPEGLHRDGVDFVLVLLITRCNIASGVTGIYSLDGQPLGAFTLTEPLDAAVVDDRRVAHGVTPVEGLVADQPSYRDVLVVTFADAAERKKAADCGR